MHIFKTIKDASKYDYIVTPFPERIGEWLKLPYTAAWLLIFSVFLSIRLFTIFSNGEPLITAIPSAGFIFLPCALGILIVSYSKLLEQFTPIMSELLNCSTKQAALDFEDEIRKIFNDKWMITAGLAFMLLFVPIVRHGGFYPTALTSQIAFLLNMAFMGFMGGAMLTVMVKIVIMVWKIGHSGVLKIQLFCHPHVSINSVGTLLGKISISLMIVYFFTVLSMIPVHIDKLTLSITITFAIVVVAFFIIPQIKIHQIMVANKYGKVSMLSELVEKALDKVKESPTQENISQIQQLFDIHKSLNEIREWPFNLQLLLSVIGSVIIPLIVCFLTFCNN